MGSFFFFQAEDGIRDLVRSRGLGDVYKRQAEQMPHAVAFEEQRAVERAGRHGLEIIGTVTVSYTHLTLPTSDLV